MPGAIDLNATDTGFLARAARGNNFEIEAAKLALRLSRPETDRAFACQMSADHRETYALFNGYGQSRYADAGLRRVVVAAKPVVPIHWHHTFDLAQ